MVFVPVCACSSADMHTSTGTPAMARMGRSEDNVVESGLSVYREEGLRDVTQVTRHDEDPDPPSV